MKEVKSRWDYPTKDGYYWTKTDTTENFEITLFRNGKFLDCLVIEKLGHNTERNYFEKMFITHWQYIPQPRKIKL